MSVARYVVSIVSVVVVATAELVGSSGRSQKQSKEYQVQSVLEPSVP